MDDRTDIAPDSAPWVQRLALPGSFTLSSGETLDQVEVAFETFGTRDADDANVVLVCHTLSGDTHVCQGDTSRPGWWDMLIGPGLAIDTDRYFIICSNVLGGCAGTTGPGSIDPSTGKRYGRRFPLVTMEDMVDVQARLLDELGISRVACVIGGSLGGMQALAWAKRYPERVTSVICDASTWRQTAQAIAFNLVGRQAILEDSAYNDGDYYDQEVQPDAGLAIARMVGHITYLSDDSMHERFGRKLREGAGYAFDFVHEFEVETYLAYQGQRFVEHFDANSYLYISKAMDYFDLWGDAPTLADAVAGMPDRTLIISYSSDWLFSTREATELTTALIKAGKPVSFAEIITDCGHDAFLIEPEAQAMLITPFIENAYEECRRISKFGHEGHAGHSGHPVDAGSAGHAGQAVD